MRAIVHKGQLQLAFTDAQGHPVQPARIDAIFGRATSTKSDQVPAFVFDGTTYRAPVVTAPGNWNLRLSAVAADGTAFHQRIIVLVD